MKRNRGLTVENVMDCLNCTKGYVYTLVRRKELLPIKDTTPIRIEVYSVINKVRRLYPFIIDKCITSLHDRLIELEYKNAA